MKFRQLFHIMGNITVILLIENTHRKAFKYNKFTGFKIFNFFFNKYVKFLFSGAILMKIVMVVLAPLVSFFLFPIFS